MSNLNVVHAIRYVTEHGRKWRGLPKQFGNWHTIYTRMNRWSKLGALDRVFGQLQPFAHAYGVRRRESASRCTNGYAAYGAGAYKQ